MSFWRYAEENKINLEYEKLFGIGELLNRLMINRNILTIEEAKIYLNPDINNITDISIAKDCEKSFEIISSAIKNNDLITIYGDYDVDGVTSTAILYKSLKGLGANVNFYLPDRHTDGYGLNMNAVKTLYENGTNLILACDNGITAIEEIKYAKELGMKVVVIDHHEPKFKADGEKREYIIPCADAVIDAKQKDCLFPYKNLCAAGMCFYYVEKLYNKMNGSFNNKKAELLALAAIATVCDMVDLKGDNRIIVRNGLKVLNHRLHLNMGLKALFEKQKSNYKITESTIGFFVGPCINAAGRLENGEIAVNMLISENENDAEKYAQKLIDLNEERKRQTSESYEVAVKHIIEKGYDKDNVIIAEIEEVNQSVAGIVAGNLKERFNKPVIVISTKNEPATGSARSIEGYNIFEALNNVSELFVKFGGHSQAAGITIKKENIELLRKNLNNTYYNLYYIPEGIIDVDFDIDFESLDVKNVSELDIMRPIGIGNEAPMFSTHNVVLKNLRLVGAEKKIMQFMFYNENGIKMKGISFNGLENFKKIAKEKMSKEDFERVFEKYNSEINLTMDIVYNAEINEYNGFRSVQLHIKDFKIH